MKKLLIAISIVSIFSLSNSAQKAVNTILNGYITDVVIKDSVLMDELNRFVTNDSIEEIIRSHFIKNFSFAPYFDNNSVFVMLGKRHLSNIECNEFVVFDDLLDSTLINVINQDSLIHIVLNLTESQYQSYRTIYKGKKYYFHKFGDNSLNGKNLFAVTKKRHSIQYDTRDVIWNSVMSDLYIPLIYYNNNLYIEPDSLQWFFMRE